MRCFVNGMQENSSNVTGAIDKGISNVLIGSRGTLGTYFNGSIDEFQIWNRSLSSSEVYQLYASNLYKFNSTQWYLTVNQSKNTSTGLDNANYNYYVYAKDVSGNENMSQIQSFTILEGTAPLIDYSFGTEIDYEKMSRGNIYVNVSLTEINLANMSFNLYNSSLNVTGMVGYWNFDRNTTVNATSYVVDVSGRGNRGVAYNGTKFNESGKLNGGAWFDGSDDYIELPDD